VKAGDKVWLSADYYGDGTERLTGDLLRKTLPNVVWGSEPFSPVLWEVQVNHQIFKVWDYLLEMNNENR
jgi:hypothetical protein